MELRREPGEPMECGIFDFYKVFSRAFGEEEDGGGGGWISPQQHTLKRIKGYPWDGDQEVV